MIVYGIDPGPRTSGVAAIQVSDDGREIRVVGAEKDAPNEVLADRMAEAALQRAAGTSERVTPWALYAVEEPKIYRSAGNELAKTFLWAGRFHQLHLLFPRSSVRDQARQHAMLLPFSTIRAELGVATRSTEAEVWQAVKDLFGKDDAEAVGTKKAPGPLFGVKGHARSALAVAIAAERAFRRGA